MSQSTTDAITRIKITLADPKTPEDAKEQLRIQLHQLEKQQVELEPQRSLRR
jgi:hypothetical protein